MSQNLELHTLFFGLKSLQAQNLHYKQSFDLNFKAQNMNCGLKVCNQSFAEDASFESDGF